jgi:cobalt-zinc-cadmium resistance protein CzcA
MIGKIVAFSIHHKLIVVLLMVGLIAWGVYSVYQIPLGTVPDITNNQVQVITTSRNLATEDIEQFITLPVELEMGNLPGVQEIRSISKFGLSVVTIIFDDKMGTYLPRQLIAEKLQSAADAISSKYGRPEMGPISTGLGEIYQYILDIKPGYEAEYSTMDLRTIQDWIVKRQLVGIPGVVEVNTWGGYLKQYEVVVTPESLRSMEIAIDDVFTALSANNENVGGGYIEKYRESYFIRGEGMAKSVQDIELIVVKNAENVPVLIRDIGEVRMGHANRFGAITANGSGEKVMGQIMMLKGANAGAVIEQVKDRIEKVQHSLPEGVYINPFLERTELIEKTTFTVVENLLFGAIIVIFVVVLLLGDIRSGLIVASVIPLSLLVSISLMNVFGLTANLMSLGAIDFGIIIDGAVIIVEFVLYQFTQNSEKLSSLSKIPLQTEKDKITMNASKRMMKSAFFGQIIILIVFVPVLSLSGIEGKMFKPMALSFSFALIGAIILCLTYVPAMSALFLKAKGHSRFNFSNWIISFIQRVYQPSLLLAMKYPKSVMLAAFSVLIISVITFAKMGGEFVPTLDEGDYVVQPVLRPGTSLTETIEFCTAIEKILIEGFPEVSQVVSRIGAAEVPTDPMSMEMSDIIIRLKPRSMWVSADSKEELADKMKEAMSVFPGIEFEFTQPIEMRFNELITGVRADVAIKIYGEDLQMLYDIATQIKSLIADVQGASDVSVEQIVGLPQMNVSFKREKVAQYGLSIAHINDHIEMAFAGKGASTIFEGEKRFQMVVRYEEASRASIENLNQLLIDLPNGSFIPLSEVADISIKRAPAQISRDDTQRRIVVGINVRKRDIESMVGEIQEIIDTNITLPSGYWIAYGGQFQNLKQAKARLQLVVPVALILIFVLLYFTFGSITQVLIIYTAIPLSAIGGVFLLAARNMPFSISAGVGFIALFGIATLNGIVLISHFNELKEKGLTDIKKLILEGTKARLRPVLLTAAAAAFGFFPMALSESAGAEVQRPLATVVIGGLFTATLLTLIVLPVIYLTVYQTRTSRSAPRKGKIMATLFFLLCLAPLLSISQTRKIDLGTAIQLARENNLEMRNAALDVENQQALVKTAWKLGPTHVSYTEGQINTALVDYSWNISQDFGAPFQQSSTANLRKLLVSQSEARQKLIERDIQLQTSQAYYALVWRQLRKELIEHEYLQYEEAVGIAEIKYQSGESNLLSKVMIESEYEELRLMLREEESALVRAQQHLMKILYVDQMFEAEADSLSRLEVDFNIDSIFSYYEHSAAQNFLNKRLMVLEQNIKVNRSSLTPALSFGYFNQSIDNLRGFDGWNLQLSVPIWFRPNSGRIQSAKIEYEIFNNAFLQQRFGIISDLRTLNHQRETLLQKLSTYERVSLRNARLIIENADLLYRNGEIGYLEYIRSISTAIGLQLSYLDSLHEYNMVVLQINYSIK